MNKKVLIITYYWPPSGGPGVQRVLKFVKYLSQFGWDPIILTVQNGEYPAIDEKLIDEVPESILVYKTKTIELFSIFKKLQGKKKSTQIETFELDTNSESIKQKLFKWIRANLFVPDARLGWKYYGISKALSLIEEHNIDLIFSSSPPHSLQMMAAKIKSRSNLPWVADYRDPWTGAFWEQKLAKSKLALNRNQKYERQTVSLSSHLIAVGKGVRDEILSTHPEKASTIIYNGYDHEDFESILKSKTGKIRIKYTGSIANSQIPFNFLQAISSLTEKQKLRFEIKFYGKFDNELVSEIQKLGIERTIQLCGYIPHEQVLREMVNAELLLLLLPRTNGKGILTGKFFEYMGSGNEILAIGPKDSEIEAIMLKHSLGRYFHFDDKLGEYLSNVLDRGINSNSKSNNSPSIVEYTRKYQTEQLAKIFDSYVK